MTLDFSEFLDVLDDDPFDQHPVGVREFVSSPDFLGQPALSEIQYTLVETMSQIYRKEDLERFMSKEEAAQHYKKYTKQEVILQCGKGCHAPYTEVFNSESGKWETLSSMSEGLVATMSGNSYSTEPFKEGIGEMVRVKTSLGFQEDVYINHKYFWMKKNKFYKRIRDNNCGSFQEIKNISVGDRIAVALNMEPEVPINIPSEYAELIGYWLGDGMLPTDTNPIINIDFSSKEHESIEKYLNLCKFIGDDPKRIDHKNKNMVSFIHGRNSSAVRIAKEMGIWGLRSKTKFIPDVVWKSDNQILAKTISMLWQTDGCIYQKNGMTAEYVSVSEKLANDVHRALLRLGIPSTLRSRVPSSNFPNASMAYYVSVTSQECFNVFIEKISLLDHKKTKKLKKDSRVYSRIENNIYWDRIVSIEPIGIGEYWTRTVPDQGHYVGNGFVSANSGKDFTSTVGTAYLVYKLLCLKDPAKYFGKPAGDAIDLINIAINAQQARNVYFKGFKTKIENSPWFAGKYDAKMDSIEFDKSITVYSGHSERESHEGLNLILAVLDEISGFAQESNTGNENAKTGDAIYKAFRASVDSRFPDYGKVILLSFPRYQGDFISKRYEDVIFEKETVVRSYDFIMNPDLPEDEEGNKFSVEWDEDHILSYKIPGVFAIKRPTWEVNPTRSINDFKFAFYTDPGDALMRFACMPNFSSDAFFKQRDKIERAMTMRNPLDQFRRLEPTFQPDPDKIYYVHADLAQKHDKCAVAISHVEKWVEIKSFNDYKQIVPFIVVDAIAWWEPRKEGPVDLSEVKNWIINLRRQGFNLGLVTFDRWQSFDIQQELKAVGIKTETLSVAKKHYEDLAMLIYEERVALPHIELLFEEMSELRIVSDKKVDHPRKKCFTGDTLIPLLDGTDVSMEELEGSEFWVYSYDISNDAPVPAKAICAQTGVAHHLVQVVLDNGAAVKCTPDHLFLLRNGTYKEAQHLVSGVDRLMPLNRHYPMSGGYEGISSARMHKTLTHRWVADYIYGGVDGKIVHHINENKLDNRPENLEVLTREEHASHHSGNPNKAKRDAMRKGTIAFNQLPETRAKRSKAAKERGREENLRRARINKNFRHDIAIDKLLEVKDAPNANAASKMLGCGRNVVVRVLKESGYESWDDFVSPIGDNHKVRSVTHIILDAPVPIYDLEVPDYSNFALTAGVIVHNSKDLADAMCGSVYNAISHTPRVQNQEIEVHTWKSATKHNEQKQMEDGVIFAPKPTKEIEDYLASIDIL